MPIIRKKLIIFDVDGVIFKSYFLLEMSRYVGLLAFLRAILLCLLLESGKVSIDDIVRQVYRKFKGLSIDDLWKIYDSMELRAGAKDAVRTLRDMGHRVILVSAGAPDFIVSHLSNKIGADGGFGIEVVFKKDSTCQSNKILTGEVKGELLEVGGKIKFVNNFLRAYEDADSQGLPLTWSDVVAIGDDRNNLEIMRKAGYSIGVNANYSVRREADALLDDAELTEIPQILDITNNHNKDSPLTNKSADQPPSRGELTSGKYDIHKSTLVRTNGVSDYLLLSANEKSHEVFRKIVHAAGALVPLVHNWSPIFTLCSLISIACLYLLSECLRLNGISFPLISKITRASARKEEVRRLAFGPLALTAGVVLSLLIFPIQLAYAVILIVALADPAACLIGKTFGAHPIPYNKNKTVEGSLAGIQVGFIAAFCYLSPLYSIIAALTAGIIESLPLKLSDNLTVPIGTGAFAWLAMSFIR